MKTGVALIRRFQAATPENLDSTISRIPLGTPTFVLALVQNLIISR